MPKTDDKALLTEVTHVRQALEALISDALPKELKKPFSDLTFLIILESSLASGEASTPLGRRDLNQAIKRAEKQFPGLFKTDGVKP